MALDLMELFGIPQNEPQKKEKEKKKEKKPAEKKSTESKKPENIKLPVTVAVKGFGKKVFKEDTLQKAEITEAELKEAIYKSVCCLTPSQMVLITPSKKGGEYKAYLKDSFIKKGSVEYKEDTTVTLFHDIYRPEELEVENGTVKVDVLSKHIKESYTVLNEDNISLSFCYCKEENTIIAKVEALHITDIPFKDTILTLPSLEQISASEILLREIAETKNNVVAKENAEHTDNEEETENAEDETEEEDKPLKELEDKTKGVKAEDVLKALIPEFDGDMFLVKTPEADTYLVVPEMTNAIPGNTSTKKEEMYDIDGVTLSLLFTQYTLSKEDFGGKKSVKKDEIKKFVISKGHREFEFNDCIIKYSDKLKILIVTLKGSTKGAKEGEAHPLFSVKNGEFTWNAPKIPWTIFIEGYRICEHVYENLGTEVLMDLYFNPESKTYHWYVPYQNVNPGSVYAVFEPFLQSYSMCGLIKVGQFHSHGSYSAFFSSTDDRDEYTPGIYGVWGGFRRRRFLEEVIDNKQYFIMRYIAPFERGGLNMFDVFEDRNIKAEQELYADIHKSAREANDWMEKISTLPGKGRFYIEYIDGKRCIVVRCRKEAEFLKQCKNLHVHNIKQIGSRYYVMPKGNDVGVVSRCLHLISTEPIEQPCMLTEEASDEYDTIFSLFM